MSFMMSSIVGIHYSRTARILVCRFYCIIIGPTRPSIQNIESKLSYFVNVWRCLLSCFLSNITLAPMNFLSGYGSDEEDSSPSASLLSASAIATNPVVSSTALSTSLRNSCEPAPVVGKDNLVLTNPKMDVLCAPELGPQHPYKKNQTMASHKRVGMGFIEDTLIDSHAFDEQYKSFLKSGYAVDSATNQVVGDYSEYVNDNQPPQKKSKADNAERKARNIRNLMTAIMKEEKDENFTGSIWTTEPHSEEVASSSTSVVDSTAEGDNEVPSTSAEDITLLNLTKRKKCGRR